MNTRHTPASFKIIHTASGNRYRFFCEACGGAVCTTKPVRADTPDRELQTAWESEGRQHFNLCHLCGKWISDVMYNADTLCCVDCTPWEDPPDYCPNCGCRVPENNTFCNECGVRLMYGGERNDGMLQDRKKRESETVRLRCGTDEGDQGLRLLRDGGEGGKDLLSRVP